MKKFLIAFLLLGTTVFMYAKKIRIHTTCGTTVIKEVPDDATTDDLVNESSSTNTEECGEKPKVVTIVVRQ